MKLYIDRPYLEPLVKRFPDLDSLLEQLKFGHRVETSFNRFSLDQLDYLAQLYVESADSKPGYAAQLLTLTQALRLRLAPFAEGQLESLLPALVDYLLMDGVRGWLFKANGEGKPIPYLVARIDFTPPGEEEAGRILLELKANAMAKLQSISLMILERDIVGKSLPEILAGKGYFKETPELIDAYERSSQRYFDWRARYGQQFTGRGTGYYAEDPTASHRNTDWSRKSRIVLSSSGELARMVNDEEIVKDRALELACTGDVLAKYLRKAGRSTNYNDRVEAQAEKLRDSIPERMFTEIPVHGYVLMFHLELHHHVWVHVDDMEIYGYQPELKDKLILPPEQTDLIDILTAEMDMLMDDVVQGKSGGTTVLCAGPPGVGKTLTAEVYSEVIRRPLYRVHSGQLGLNVMEMEQALKNTLIRAQRWGAVMLIDEADVYIKRRDDNIAANAVVGVFLRVLEYFNGLLFLTTNRVDDIDEAIVSRCIALIKYHPPGRDDRLKIWQVMTGQFKLPVSDALLTELVEMFPAASGRDIKGLVKLVAKYCQHKSVSPELPVFQLCSIFRGMEAVR
ncbi:AAA family ATPase [Ketobacter sp.]|uniref:AAA family ATPase n=1 Tax=Ketobacter sp. TaxID=2083498 RepID=UPI000F14870F|nr:ATP-binding protein [Ketobacter sp.]RLT93275.1 MAG: ATP-binding protein [Ketobacter sp.]